FMKQFIFGMLPIHFVGVSRRDGRVSVASCLLGVALAVCLAGSVLAQTSPAAAPTAANPPVAQPTAPAAVVPAAAASTTPSPAAEAPAQPADATPAQPVIGAAALPRDLSPWGMFLNADIIVKIVMVGLVFASLVTWTVWLGKNLELWK